MGDKTIITRLSGICEYLIPQGSGHKFSQAAPFGNISKTVGMVNLHISRQPCDCILSLKYVVVVVVVDVRTGETCSAKRRSLPPGRPHNTTRLPSISYLLVT